MHRQIQDIEISLIKIGPILTGLYWQIADVIWVTQATLFLDQLCPAVVKVGTITAGNTARLSWYYVKYKYILKVCLLNLILSTMMKFHVRIRDSNQTIRFFCLKISSKKTETCLAQTQSRAELRVILVYNRESEYII